VPRNRVAPLINEEGLSLLHCHFVLWRKRSLHFSQLNMTLGSDQYNHLPIVGRAVRIAATGLGLCVLFIGGISLWNVVAEEQWSHQHPAPGTFYSVEGKQMHIDCTGTGSPTVVMESAASARWTQWRKVRPGLSQEFVVLPVCLLRRRRESRAVHQIEERMQFVDDGFRVSWTAARMRIWPSNVILVSW